MEICSEKYEVIDALEYEILQNDYLRKKYQKYHREYVLRE